jgi:hypothetical protein
MPNEKKLARIIGTASPPRERASTSTLSTTPDPEMKGMLQAITQAITTISVAQSNNGGGSKLDTKSLELQKLAPLSNLLDWKSNLDDGQHYQVWETLARMKLQSKGVFYVVEKDPPSKTDSSYSKWQQHNSLVFSVLTEALPAKEQNRFIFMANAEDAARQVWRGIKELYFRTTQFDYMKLQDELREFGPHSGENMACYT